MAKGVADCYLLESVGYGYVSRTSAPTSPVFVKNPRAALALPTKVKANVLLNAYRKGCRMPHVVQGLRVVTYEYSMDVPQYPGG